LLEVMTVAGVIIGIDPHKGSHAAIALDGRETRLGQLRVRASAEQAQVLLQWAARWPKRTWAIEGARGLGQLLSQQLIGARERCHGFMHQTHGSIQLADPRCLERRGNKLHDGRVHTRRERLLNSGGLCLCRFPFSNFDKPVRFIDGLEDGAPDESRGARAMRH